MGEYALQATGLHKRFKKTVALDGVDLTARPGTVLGVLGPNGAGKTTAIRVLATLAKPDAGSARVGGFDVVRQASRVRRLVGMTGQRTTVDEELTGLGNLVLLGRLLGLSRSDAARRATELLDRFGLGEEAKRLVSTYSGGMRRRLDLAASLVGRPAVVFLDEPSVGLDPGKREDLWRLVRELTHEGTTVLLTTQYLEEADVLADTISVIDHGRVIADGSPAALKKIVGGQAIAVTPADAARIDDAAVIMTAVAGRPVERVSTHELVVPVESDAAVLDLARGFADARIGLTEFSLRLPSLDEVFFTLTGTRTSDTTPKESV